MQNENAYKSTLLHMQVMEEACLWEHASLMRSRTAQGSICTSLARRECANTLYNSQQQQQQTAFSNFPLLLHMVLLLTLLTPEKVGRRWYNFLQSKKLGQRE